MNGSSRALHSRSDTAGASRLTSETLELLLDATAMGLVDLEESSGTLDRELLTRAVERIAGEGIARAAAARLLPLLGRPEPDPAEVVPLIEAIRRSLRENPAPRRELASLVDILGESLVAKLAGVHPSSVRRYRRGEREVPDVVADRLHLLALTVGDLLGAYDELGVRRWFERRRTQLGGEAPGDLLAGDWSSRDRDPQRVRELAAALRSSPAT